MVILWATVLRNPSLTTDRIAESTSILFISRRGESEEVKLNYSPNTGKLCMIELHMALVLDYLLSDSFTCDVNVSPTLVFSLTHWKFPTQDNIHITWAIGKFLTPS